MFKSSSSARYVPTVQVNGIIYKMGDADGDNDVLVLDATNVQVYLASGN